MAGDRPLNPTAASLLGLLATGDMSGYQLHQTAQTVFGDFWTVTRSQIYRELATMAASGLVAAGEEGPRSRRPYHLTDTGHDAFAEWIGQEPGPEVIRFPLLMTINFGAWLGRDRLLEFAAAQRPAHESRLARYRDIAATAEEHDQPYAGATVAFGIHYEQAVLAWMDELPALLDDVPAQATTR
ncbi:MAG: PadR family transcriptional regulator [Nocardioidaceae bacterium]